MPAPLPDHRAPVWAFIAFAFGAMFFLAAPGVSAQEPGNATFTIVQNSPADPDVEFLYNQGLFALEHSETVTVTILADNPAGFVQGTPPAGWDVAAVVCTGETDFLTISPGSVAGWIPDGGNVTCTYTNMPLSSSPTDTEILPAVTCLAGNGRIDINIINTGSSSAVYRLDIGALSPRQSTVEPKRWWRSPVTGRPDGPIQATVSRDGTVIWSEQLMVTCDNGAAVSAPEVQIMNWCVAGRGFVFAQMANPNGTARSYVLDVEGLRRSTTAAAHGAAVRGVSGRPNGDLNVSVFVGSTALATETVTIDC